MKKQAWMKATGILLAAGLLTGCGAQKAQQTEAVTEAAATEEAVTEAVVTEAAATEEDTTEAVSIEPADSGENTTVSAAGWKLTVEDVEISESLENVSVELGYTGVETSDYQKTAEEGNVFCLIKMKIEKDGSKEVIDWKNMTLTDSDGNEYTRMSDEFLTDLGMARMPGTSLNFGSNEGWIVFEVKENAAGLELAYPFEAETYHCVLE